MQITLEIPDDLAAQLTAAGKEPSRAALEALAVEGYRTQRLTEFDVRKMLGFDTRMEVHALLKEHGAYLHYTLEDLERDDQTAQHLRERRSQEQSGSASTAA